MGFTLTLTKLLIYTGIAGFILTAISGFVLKGHKSWIMSFFQNFCGVLFLFSGYVKAVDPLGTAYKMEQYFTEFQSTFEHTWFSFVAPFFPWLSQYAASVSVLMIVFEIVLGLALIIGYKPKWTAWLFFGLIVFFAVLTGFTYLTGYVGEGVNFFQFGQWSAYKASNMKVTDCGCFGDFLKLEPKVSFLKDVFLMIPAIYFILKHRDMHQFFTEKIRLASIVACTLLVTVYCFSNFVWDIPKIDFRPFRKGADIKNIRIQEEDAAANVQILAWILKNKNDDSTIELTNAEYMGNLAKYPNTEWSVVDQVKSEPAIKSTKISEFEISNTEGEDITYQILEDPEYSFMIVSYKMYGKPVSALRMVQDSIFSIDTLIMDDGVAQVSKKLEKVESREEKYYDYVWDDEFKKGYEEDVMPLLEKAKAAGIKSYVVAGGAGIEMIEDFTGETGLTIPFYTADDILLKTIVRSNPGVVLWKDGKILDKWHHDQLPSFDQIKTQYIR